MPRVEEVLTMVDPRHPDRGAIISYLGAPERGGRPVRQALATGPFVRDPSTDKAWVPVQRPDSSTTLLDLDLVVDVEPPAPERTDRTVASVPDSARPVEVLRVALDVAVRGLAEVDERDLRAWFAGRRLLTEFIDTIVPVHESLFALVESTPPTGLVAVLAHVIEAAARLEAGDVVTGRNEMMAAHRVMATMSAAG
jgi:hypothetical protein